MIKFGFQTYAWQMSYDKYAGKIEHILDITKQSGLNAVEAEICMLKDYFENPEALKELLTKKDMNLSALCLVCDWLGCGETSEEKLLADKAIKYVQNFPNAILVLCQMPQNDRKNLAKRQKNALMCINNAAKRSNDKGLSCAFHPNSPAGSVFRFYDDYKLMLDGLDSRYVGFAPDSGHIIKGGMNAYDIFRDYISIIKHAHFKDIDANGSWRVMGEGITDFPQIAEILKNGEYDGYVMIEDESSESKIDPDNVCIKNGKYINSVLL
jgi:inosose dehydratase